MRSAFFPRSRYCRVAASKRSRRCVAHGDAAYCLEVLSDVVEIPEDAVDVVNGLLRSGLIQATDQFFGYVDVEVSALEVKRRAMIVPKAHRDSPLIASDTSMPTQYPSRNAARYNMGAPVVANDGSSVIPPDCLSGEDRGGTGAGAPVSSEIAVTEPPLPSISLEIASEEARRSYRLDQ